MHLIRAEEPAAAFALLRLIVNERRLRCGTGYVKGRHCCICFTEAPLSQLRDVLLWSHQLRRLQPYGVMVGKGFLFDLGGQPVIYQPDSDYDALPEQSRYRHVRYEPTGTRPIDFTWEREWRLLANELPIGPENCSLIVRTEEERQALLADIRDQREQEHQLLETAVGAHLASLFWEDDFSWGVLAVESISDREKRASPNAGV